MSENPRHIMRPLWFAVPLALSLMTSVAQAGDGLPAHCDLFNEARASQVASQQTSAQDISSWEAPATTQSSSCVDDVNKIAENFKINQGGSGWGAILSNLIQKWISTQSGKTCATLANQQAAVTQEMNRRAAASVPGYDGYVSTIRNAASKVSTYSGADLSIQNIPNSVTPQSIESAPQVGARSMPAPAPQPTLRSPNIFGSY